MLVDATYNAMLNNQFPSGAGNVYLSAHTAYHATGGNLTGAKTSANFSAASARQKALSTAVDIAIGAGVTVRWIGLWDSTQATFLGMYPNGGSDLSFQVDLTNNRVYCEGHGRANNDTITFHNDTPPAGLTAGVTYFVVGVTPGDPDYFQVSLTSGGAAVDITAQAGPQCVVSQIVEEVYAGAGTHRVSTLTINL